MAKSEERVPSWKRQQVDSMVRAAAAMVGLRAERLKDVKGNGVDTFHYEVPGASPEQVIKIVAACRRGRPILRSAVAKGKPIFQLELAQREGSGEGDGLPDDLVWENL